MQWRVHGLVRRRAPAQRNDHCQCAGRRRVPLRGRWQGASPFATLHAGCTLRAHRSSHRHSLSAAANAQWHLGQRDEYLPTSNAGFHEYLGVPFSQDMGTSFWAGRQTSYPFRPTPLPLLNGSAAGGVSVIEQPADLSTLVSKYVNFASAFISRNTQAQRPWYLYVPFNHVHAPNSCNPRFCGRSPRGPVGDAVEETDWAVGQIMAVVAASGAAASNTITFFTSDNGAPLGAKDSQATFSSDFSGNLPLRGASPLVTRARCVRAVALSPSHTHSLSAAGGKAQVWEGGFREPAIIHWPGRIKAGSISQAVASTMDIHVTILALAQQPLPTDRVIDGMDLSKVIFGQGGADQDQGHACYYFYRAAAAVNASQELFAVRCGEHKMYWATNGAPPPNGSTCVPDHCWSCRSQYTCDPPLLVNLITDPGENTPISPNSAEYAAIREKITAAKAAHVATITPVPDQNGRGSDLKYAICGAVNTSTAAVEEERDGVPACTMTPANWRPEGICSSQACRASDKSVPGKCGNGSIDEL